MFGKKEKKKKYAKLISHSETRYLNSLRLSYQCTIY